MTLEVLAQQNAIKQNISIWYQVFRNYIFNKSISLELIIPKQGEVQDYNLWCVPLREKRETFSSLTLMLSKQVMAILAGLLALMRWEIWWGKIHLYLRGVLVIRRKDRSYKNPPHHSLGRTFPKLWKNLVITPGMVLKWDC